MAIATGRLDGDPMMEMNTTPLIDVMLVLLIMFIITIPIQTHAVKVDLPGVPPTKAVRDTKNILVLDRGGTTFWNGAVVRRDVLKRYLVLSARAEPEPELHFQPDAQARYDAVDALLSDIRRAGVSKLGFVGNERYRAF